MECTICLNPFTSSLRKKVGCPYCRLEACLTCVKRYMLESPEDAHCMGCKRAWNRDFIDSYLTSAFRKGALKTHRETTLVDRERARLPLLQPRIEARVQANALSDRIATVNQELRALELKAVQIRENVLRLHRRQGRLFQVAAGTLPIEQLDADGAPKEARTFTQKCPMEDCRGFLSSQWKCGTCQTWVCPDCLVPKGKERDAAHTCNEDAKATATLIRKETRPCPKCGEGISKVDGCDQMWCITCKTPFSWSTGRMVFGVVHNPHYYQWLRQQNGGEAPRVAGDVPCGGVIGYYTLSQVTPLVNRREIEGIHRVTAELHDQILREYPRFDEVPDNGDLGIEYSLKIITMDEWKSKLWQRETKREKGLDLRGPLDLFANVSSEVLRRMANGVASEFLDLLNQLRALRTYVNEEIEKIGKRYSCTVPKITGCWRWDPHGGNRKELLDTRVYAEKILLLKPEILAGLDAVQKTAVNELISRYCIEQSPVDGVPSYAIEQHTIHSIHKTYKTLVSLFDAHMILMREHAARCGTPVPVAAGAAV